MAIAEASPAETNQPHGDVIRVITDPNSPEWQDAFGLEAQVFIEAEYVADADELAEEYAKYLPGSEFVVAERNGEAGGSIRIIYPEAGAGFKTVDDIDAGKLPVTPEGQAALDSLDMNDALEVGTLGVKREFRGSEAGRLSVVLFGAIYGLTQKHNKDHVLASFDERFFEMFKLIFDPGVMQLGPATEYMGSPTVPSLIHVPTLIEHTKANHPDIYSTMIEAAAKV